MILTSLPVFDTTCIYAGDFNGQHTEREYNKISPDGECLAVWAANNDLTLLQDFKGIFTFHLGRWKSEANPDLAFARTETSSQLPDRRVLGKFPRSQHRPSLITASHRITSASKPVKRWNFSRLIGNAMALLPTILPRSFHYQTHVMRKQHTKLSAI